MTCSRHLRLKLGSYSQEPELATSTGRVGSLKGKSQYPCKTAGILQNINQSIYSNPVAAISLLGIQPI